MGRRLVGLLPHPGGNGPTDLAYAEATARRLAARQTADALEIFAASPGIRQETLQHAQCTLGEWQQRAVAQMDELDGHSPEDAQSLLARQVHILAEAAASRELAGLVESGLLPEKVLRSTGTAQRDHPR